MAGGRPKKEIDYVLVERLATIMCTQQEIADVLDISVRTLQRDDEFCRIYKKAINNGKAVLRRNLFKMSGHNASALIFACKCILGMKEYQSDTDNDEEYKKMLNGFFGGDEDS